MQVMDAICQDRQDLTSALWTVESASGQEVPTYNPIGLFSYRHLCYCCGGPSVGKTRVYPLEAGSMRFVLISNSNDESSFFSMHTPHNEGPFDYTFCIGLRTSTGIEVGALNLVARPRPGASSVDQSHRRFPIQPTRHS